MFGSETLDVAIGMIFVFILVSIVCSAVREGIESVLKTRAAYLNYGIRELLNDVASQGLAKSFYDHPLISGLFSGTYAATGKRPGLLAKGGNLPSYIPAKNFALALMDLAARGTGPTPQIAPGTTPPIISLESIRDGASKLQNPKIERVLLLAIDNAQGDINKAQATLESWFDSGMDRVSGWYKRSTGKILFGIACFATLAMNVNTITIAQHLQTNDAARAAIVAGATKAAEDPNFLADNSSNYQAVQTKLDDLKLPIGWPDGFLTPPKGANPIDWWWTSIVGWLITAFAASLGAPFWFDVLNKVMVIRSTVKPHEKSPEEGSEDRLDKKEKPEPQPPALPPAQPALPAQVGGVVPVPGVAVQPVLVPVAGAVPAEGVVPVVVPAAVPAAPLDPEDELDGCDVEILDETSDEDLPPAEGGVL
ncbi:MAG: hypothetical protein ACO1SV_25550 [Fimbriimonas sp.]